jgi:hypothetical protein
MPRFVHLLFFCVSVKTVAYLCRMPNKAFFVLLNLEQFFRL